MRDYLFFFFIVSLVFFFFSTFFFFTFRSFFFFQKEKQMKIKHVFYPRFFLLLFLLFVSTSLCLPKPQRGWCASAITDAHECACACRKGPEENKVKKNTSIYTGTLTLLHLTTTCVSSTSVSVLLVFITLLPRRHHLHRANDPLLFP